tara:strand:+ start:1026 stop:2597 length:1572 start_codon:yes stop_codon:yes gene_type:complete
MDKRTKEAYLGKARHNLKNPINAILGYSEMLIEDCEDEGINGPISDLNKLYDAGQAILEIIEQNFDDRALENPDKTLVTLAKDTEIAVREPLNTIVGYSELLIEDNESIDIENFHSDINRISDSGRLLEKELTNIIKFNEADIDSLNDDSKVANYSMVQDVMESIQPLDKKEEKPQILGKLLVVDDNKNNTQLLKKRLSKQGHDVVTAHDGRDATESLINNLDTDLILLDIVMPEMNGYEVLKFIRSDNRFHELPVIMISSMDDTDSIYRCIEAGADDYITKPFEKSILDARIASCMEKKKLRDKEKVLMQELQEERDRSEHLLLNILPKDIAQRLKSGETDIANKHEDVSIIFCDIINFTPQAQVLSPNNLVKILNVIFKTFDDLANKHNIEKIKTIGDSYFAVGGLNTDKSQSANDIIELGKDFIKAINVIDKNTNKMELNIRIGVHTGPIVAGVIGKNKFAYDLWGAAVNMANRLETTCPPGCIQISEHTKTLLGDNYSFEIKEKTKIKGIGEVNTYLVT